MNNRAKTALEDLANVLVLAFLAGLVLYPTLFGGQTPVRSMEDAGASSLPWAMPSYAFAHDAFERGDSLLWNPLEHGGTPFFAQWTTRCLSPFTLPLLYFPLEIALRLSAYLKLLVAGGAAYYTARKLGFRPGFAMLAAVAYQLSPALLLYLDQPLSDAYAWAPLFFLFIERLSLNQWRRWPTGALIVALLLLSGEPGFVLSLGMAGLLLFLVRLSTAYRPKDAKHLVTAYGVAFLMGIGLAGAQIVPHLAWLPYSAAHEPVAGTMIAPADMSYLFLSTDEHTATKNTASLAPNPTELATLHFGLVQLLLVVVWVALRHHITTHHRFRIDTLLVLSGIIMLAALFLPLPLRALSLQLHRAQLLALLAFPVSLTAAAAAEAWLELSPEQCNSTLRRLGLAAPLLLILAGYIVIASKAPTASFTPDLLFPILLASALSGGVAFVLIAALLRPSPAIISFGLAALTVLDLGLLAGPLMPSSQIDPEGGGAYAATIEQPHERVVVGSQTPDALLKSHALRQSRGSALLPMVRYEDYRNLADADPRLYTKHGGRWLLLGKEDLRGEFGILRDRLYIRQVLPSGTGLFENPAAPSRATLLFQGEYGDASALDEIDVKSVPLFAASQPIELANEDPRAVATIVNESNATIRVETSATEPSVLVIADTYAHGWKAFVNGKETEVFAVDSTFRGVALPAGDHRVSLAYAPRSVRVGLAVSVFSILVVIAGLIQMAVTRGHHALDERS